MNRVARRTWFHSLFRWALNSIGSFKGHSGCGICGDSWWFKKGHTIQTDERGSGMFPYCEECHETASKDQKHKAITELGHRWASQLPLGDKERMDLNVAHQAVNEE